MSPEREPRSLDVLVAEDAPANAKVITLLLERLGHRVEVVENGRLALEAIAQRSYDLVLMDVRMPHIDGIEATRQIRAREAGSGRRLPIVALTGSKLDEDVERCLRAGMNAHLAKPVALQALRATISSVLTGRAPDEAASQPAAVSEAAGNGAFRPEQALATLAGHRELLAEVTRNVVDQSPRVLREAQSALQQRDTVALESAAHRLKSMLRLVAAEPSARAAERLEGLAQEARLSECESTLAALEAEVRRLLEALRQSLRSA